MKKLTLNDTPIQVESAILDGLGNNIANTYAKSANIGNGILTITQNGTSKGTFSANASGNITIALTDNNTTYSAGTGLSLSGTAFSVKYGTASGTACQGNDSRLSNARTPTAHNQASNTITAMTGYRKASSVTSISTSDSLNTAVGKLEKSLDGKVPTSRTVNSKALSGDIVLGAKDIGFGVSTVLLS